MKFKVTLQELQKALDKTSPAMPKKSTLPILEHFNFKLSEGELRIIATDQDLTIMTFLKVESSEDGEILVPGKRINDFVKTLDGSDEIEISTTDKYDIKLKTATGKYSMKGIAPEEYLVLNELFESAKPDLENLKHISVVDQAKNPAAFFGKDEMIRLAEKTVYAVGTDEYRPAMTGVLFQFKGEYVNAVATDSYRLVRAISKPSEGVFPQDLDVIIPARTMEQLKKVDNDVIISFIKTDTSITHIRFDIDDMVIISRLIDEKFPPYESVLPKNNELIAIVPKDQLLRAIRRTAIFTNKNSNMIKLNFENNLLTILGEDDDTASEGSEQITCEYSGEPILIGFNYKFLAEAVANVTDNTDDDETKVRMTFSEPTRPALITPSPDTEDLLMLLMPLRI
jgi:DNA polymerase-3 subunit beta